MPCGGCGEVKPDPLRRRRGRCGALLVLDSQPPTLSGGAGMEGDDEQWRPSSDRQVQIHLCSGVLTTKIQAFFF